MNLNHVTNSSSIKVIYNNYNNVFDIKNLIH